jgi:hypothetical protein
MPADSNLLNSALASQVFLDQSGGILQKLGVSAGVDMMLNPMGWCGLHIPVLKMEGIF